MKRFIPDACQIIAKCHLSDQLNDIVLMNCVLPKSALKSITSKVIRHKEYTQWKSRLDNDAHFTWLKNMYTHTCRANQ